MFNFISMFSIIMAIVEIMLCCISNMSFCFSLDHIHCPDFVCTKLMLVFCYFKKRMSSPLSLKKIGARKSYKVG